MAITALGNGSKLEASAVSTLASSAGLKLSSAAIEDHRLLLGTFDDYAEKVLAAEDDLPVPDLSVYPRTDISIPAAEESDKGGWATRCTVKSTEKSGELLSGRTIALKDNIALAGVRCTNGVAAVGEEWVPTYDATVVTRILDAGGVITGKATCENCCMEAMSDTSITGPVHNFYADGYSCGGSSSGSGRLVASGAVEMTLGCDQGGSVRIPASMCGIVGLKPTWGLVPYTGILGLEATIDHCGPMTKTVEDCALLLEAIAGPDGRDDRQPIAFSPESLRFSAELKTFLSTAASGKPLEGFKVGILKEGFDLPQMDAHVSAACRSAVTDFESLGAEVVEISIPGHDDVCNTWMCALPFGGGRDGLLGDATGRKQLYMTDRASGPYPKFSQAAFDMLGPGAQNLYMRYLHVADKYGATLHAKANNLLRKATRAYDAALTSVDVLVMPTLPYPAPPITTEKYDGEPLKRLARTAGLLNNTAPFNSTGHPALSIPVGFVPAPDNESVKLPAGLQLVGKQFGDLTCLKIAAAWEKSKDWKTLTF